MNLNNFVRNNAEHNFAVLENLSHADRYLVLLYITDTDIHRGKAGKIYSCAAAECAKEHFGRGCEPTVKQDKKGITCLNVSNRETRRRYRMELGIFDSPGAFDPERFDVERGLQLPSRGGAVLVQNVTVGPMPVDQYPRDETGRKDRRSLAERDTRKPREWKPVGLKGKTRKSDPVIDTLSGAISNPYTEDFIQ